MRAQHGSSSSSSISQNSVFSKTQFFSKIHFFPKPCFFPKLSFFNTQFLPSKRNSQVSNKIIFMGDISVTLIKVIKSAVERSNLIFSSVRVQSLPRSSFLKEIYIYLFTYFFPTGSKKYRPHTVQYTIIILKYRTVCTVKYRKSIRQNKVFVICFNKQ